MADREDTSSLAGARLGHYLVGPQLGSGSMGQVHRARDLFDGRAVALKLHRRRAEDQALRRFVQEARALAAIEHPGVAAVYDAGRDGDLLWIAMELALGRPLSEVLEPGALPWPAAVALLLPVVEAVASAHAAGVMHRDIKPANVVVADDGTAKLVDFGLAKRIGEIPQAAEGGETVWDWAEVRTAPGSVLGTPAYMSPEQARAQPVDARSDVFALGVVLWEAIAGRALFRRATAAATLRAILTEAAPRLDTLGRAPEALAVVVAHALENDPGRRYADAQRLAEALRAVSPPQASTEPTLCGLEPATGAVVGGRLLGRAVELASLGRALARRVREVAVVGGPASGKTRLVDEAIASLGDVRVLRLEGAPAPEPAMLEGVRIVVVDRPLGALVDLRAALDEAAPRATLLRVGPRWAGAGLEHVVEVGPIGDDAARAAFPGVDAPSALALLRSVGGHPLGVQALGAAIARGQSPASLLGALEAPDAWPPALGDVAAALDASLARAAPALGTLGRIALLPRVDPALAAALLGTTEEGAARALAELEAWSLVERTGGSWLALAPLLRRRIAASRRPDAEDDAALDRALSALAARAEALARALDEGTSESTALRQGLRELEGLPAACAEHALARGAPALLAASARLGACVRRARRDPAGAPLLRAVLAAGARVGAPSAALSVGHASLGTLESARQAVVLADADRDPHVSLEASLALAHAAASAGVPDEAQRAADAAVRHAESLAAPGSVARASLALADAAWARSDAPAARRAFDRAASVAAAALDEGQGALAELGRAQLALAMGDDEAAHASLERAELFALSSRRARIAALARATLAELSLRRGEVEAAREDVSIAAGHARALAACPARVVLVAAEVELAQGRPLRAAELARVAGSAMDGADAVGRAVATAIESVALFARSPARARALGLEATRMAETLGRVEAATVAAWLGSAAGADPVTALDVLSLPPRPTTFPGTCLALAARAVELGLAQRRSRWPVAS